MQVGHNWPTAQAGQLAFQAFRQVGRQAGRLGHALWHPLGLHVQDVVLQELGAG